MLSITVLLLSVASLVYSSPPPDTIQCISGTANCTVTNASGIFPDRSTCRAANASYPTTEQELVAAVAAAVASKTKMKAVSRTTHSLPKLSCPGGNDGLLISTKYLNHVVGVDLNTMMLTVEAGMTLKELIDAAAEVGLALPNGPYWYGITVGGLLATGAHGSSLWGKGSAVHDYVVGVRIVTPASAAEGYAVVRSIGAGDPDLDAVKVSLGVLGVISQVTFKLEPMFKRSVTFVTKKDTDLASVAEVWGNAHEFGDMTWYPGHRSVVYRIDHRLPTNVSGDGHYDYFLPRSAQDLVADRLIEENMEATNLSKCSRAATITSLLNSIGYGFKNHEQLFTGYPIVGFQNKLQAAGGCINSLEDDLLTVCPWDPRVKGEFYFQTTFTIALSKVRDFILDVQKLRDLTSDALCNVDLYGGILMRYMKASTTYMGKLEDSMDFDISYYRSHDPATPRLDEEVLEEVEQIGLLKYGGLPHWGKNRNLAFDGVIAKYSWRKEEFLKVKDLYDPDGLFSNEWNDQMFGIKGRTSIYKPGCALEGLCVCFDDVHCAPGKGYFCKPGKVYTAARVCSPRQSYYATS